MSSVICSLDTSIDVQCPMPMFVDKAQPEAERCQLLQYLCCDMVIINSSEQCIKERVGLNNSEAGRLELHEFIPYSIPSLPFIALNQLKLQHVKLMSSFSHRSFKETWFCSSRLPLIPLAEPHSGHFNMG